LERLGPYRRVTDRFPQDQLEEKEGEGRRGPKTGR
jgi:hypothetical protein